MLRIFTDTAGVRWGVGIWSNTAHERHSSLAHISHSWRFYPAVGEPPFAGKEQVCCILAWL